MSLSLSGGFYAQSASEAIFKARTYSRKIIQSGDDDYLMNETRRKPTTGRQSPSLFEWVSESGHLQTENIMLRIPSYLQHTALACVL